MRLPLFALMVACVARTAPALAAEPVDSRGAAVLSRLQEAAEGYESLQFTIVQEITAMGQAIRASGRVQAAGERMAMTMTMQMPNGMAMEQRTVTTADTAWTYMPMMNLVSKIDLARLREMAPDMGNSMGKGSYNFAAALDRDDVEYLGQTTYAETPAEHFAVRLERVPFAQGQQLPNIPEGGRTEVWLRSTDGMPLRLEIYDAQGQAVFTQRFEDIVINEDIPQAVFEFVPPEGAQVIDMTDMMLQMARAEGRESPPSPGAAPPAPIPQSSAAGEED